MKPPIEPAHIHDLLTSEYDEPLLIWRPHHRSAGAVTVISADVIGDAPGAVIVAHRHELLNVFSPPGRPDDPEPDWCERVAGELAQGYLRDTLPADLAGGRR